MPHTNSKIAHADNANTFAPVKGASAGAAIGSPINAGDVANPGAPPNNGAPESGVPDDGSSSSNPAPPAGANIPELISSSVSSAITCDPLSDDSSTWSPISVSRKSSSALMSTSPSDPGDFSLAPSSVRSNN